MTDEKIPFDDRIGPDTDLYRWNERHNTWELSTDSGKTWADSIWLSHCNKITGLRKIRLQMEYERRQGEQYPTVHIAPDADAS